jgi:hypothetical protein
MALALPSCSDLAAEPLAPPSMWNEKEKEKKTPEPIHWCCAWLLPSCWGDDGMLISLAIFTLLVVLVVPKILRLVRLNRAACQLPGPPYRFPSGNTHLFPRDTSSSRFYDAHDEVTEMKGKKETKKKRREREREKKKERRKEKRMDFGLGDVAAFGWC